MKRICLSLLVLLLACAAGRAQVVVCYADSADGYWGDAGTVVTPYVTYPTSMVGAYSQNRVTAVRLALGAAATNVYLYIKRDPHDTQPLYRQKVGNLPAGWHDIALETPFEIDGSQPLCLATRPASTLRAAWPTAQGSTKGPEPSTTTARTTGHRSRARSASMPSSRATTCRKVSSAWARCPT